MLGLGGGILETPMRPAERAGSARLVRGGLRLSTRMRFRSANIRLARRRCHVPASSLRATAPPATVRRFDSRSMSRHQQRDQTRPQRNPMTAGRSVLHAVWRMADMSGSSPTTLYENVLPSSGHDSVVERSGADSTFVRVAGGRPIPTETCSLGKLDAIGASFCSVAAIGEIVMSTARSDWPPPVQYASMGHGDNSNSGAARRRYASTGLMPNWSHRSSGATGGLSP